MKHFLLTIFCFAMVLSLPAQSRIVAYEFQDGTRYDVGGNRYELAKRGNPEVVDGHDGQTNSAISFPGYSDLYSAAGALGFVNKEISVSVWVNIRDGHNSYAPVLGDFQVSVGGYALGVANVTDRMRFDINTNFIEDPTPVVFDEWIHYAATFDGEMMRLYRNGVLVAEANNPGAISTNETEFRVGRRSDNYSVTLNGSVDDLYLVDLAFEANQIQDIYMNGYLNMASDAAIINNQTVSSSLNTAQVEAELLNTGNDVITSVELIWSDGVNEHSSVVENLDIQPDEFATIASADLITTVMGEETEFEIRIGQVNGTEDDFPNNNGSIQGTCLGVNKMFERRVIIEEGTGTWCGFCPAGVVGLEYMNEHYYDDIIVIALHDGDPMEMSNMNTGFNSFPGGRLDRQLRLYPSPEQLEPAFLSRVKDPVLSDLKQTVYYDPDTREVTIILNTEFAVPTVADLRFNAVIVEDNVSGLSNGYDQTNYFASGNYGPMGGYENMSNPVPASQMIYDHVAREFLGLYEGTSNTIPLIVDVNENFEHRYNYTLPMAYDDSEVSVVGLVINRFASQFYNSRKTHLSDALQVSTTSLDVEYGISVFPNPTSDLINVNIASEDVELHSVQLISAAGALILEQDSNGSNQTSMNVSNVTEGTYLVAMQLDGQTIVRHVNIVH